jgi:hypothetical protein
MLNKVTAFATAALLITAAFVHADDAKTKAAAAKSAVKNSACQMRTGSRIPVKSRECVEFGRSYTQDEVRTTGATSAADALRLLDPSVTIHH